MLPKTRVSKTRVSKTRVSKTPVHKYPGEVKETVLLSFPLTVFSYVHVFFMILNSILEILKFTFES